jgi:egghead protein (zeste-white 4 protein)
MPQTEVPDEYGWMKHPSSHPYPLPKKAPWEEETITDMHAIQDGFRPLSGIDLLEQISREQHTTEEMPVVELDNEHVSPRTETLMHRIRVSSLVSAAIAILYAGQDFIWPHSPLPHGYLQDIWAWSGILWATAAIPAVFELIGLMMWRAPHAEARPIGNLVCYRIVSRGLNKEALAGTINAIRVQMARNPMFPYVIEAVVDTDTSEDGLPPEEGNLRYIRVPKNYSTPNGTLKKARALHYANEPGVSLIPPKTYIMHCDEETHPTHSSIDGLAAAIREEEDKCAADPQYRPRIGQGTITYHRDLDTHLFFTLSDCIRTGSDLGRLYLSMIMGVPVFGLHGSYIMIRDDVEKEISLDVGPEGSLTEDAWFGAMAMEKGYRCRWVEGHMAEQCTFKKRDFWEQRRRWHSGLVRTSLHVPTKLRWRIGMLISMIAWSLAPLSILYTVSHFFFGGYTDPGIRMAANFSLAVYVATTLVGLRVNLIDHGITSRARKIKLALTWLIYLPASSLMEAIGVSYSIVKPAKGFYVVKK